MLSIENQMYVAKQHPESYFSNKLSDRKKQQMFQNACSYADTKHAIAISCYMYSHTHTQK